MLTGYRSGIEMKTFPMTFLGGGVHSNWGEYLPCECDWYLIPCSVVSSSKGKHSCMQVSLSFRQRGKKRKVSASELFLGYLLDSSIMFFETIGDEHVDLQLQPWGLKSWSAN